MTLADALRLWRVIRGFDSATASDSIVGDCAPRPGVAGRSVGDGLLRADDVDRLLDYLLGTVSAAEFAGVPGVDRVWPAAVIAGDSLVSFFVWGGSFTGACSLTVEPSAGVRVLRMVVRSDSLIEGGIAVDSTAAPGTRDVRVAGVGGPSATGPLSRLTILPSEGPAVSVEAIPDTLRLVSGGPPGHITLLHEPEPAESLLVNLATADAGIAGVAATFGAGAGLSLLAVPVTPGSPGTTTVSGTWDAQVFSVPVVVEPAEVWAFPDSFHMFQAGLPDTLVLMVSPHLESTAVLLSSSNPSALSVPSLVGFPAGVVERRIELLPGMVPGEVVVTARLPEGRGGTEIRIGVRVEPLRLTLIPAETPVTLQDDVVKDDPLTPLIDEGFGVGTSGMILSLNGPSRLAQSVDLEALPAYVPGVTSGFNVTSPVVIPPGEIWWPHHFGGIVEGSQTPPFGGTIRGRLTLAPVETSEIPVLMGYGPPGRGALRFCDEQLEMVPGQMPRFISALVDQANGTLELPPDWGLSVTGSAVTVTPMPHPAAAALLLSIAPLEPGSSRIIVTCPPDLADTITVNVLGVEIVPTTGDLRAPSEPGVLAEVFYENTDGLEVLAGARLDLRVRLPGADGANGTLVVVAQKDRFGSAGRPKPDAGPDIAVGSTPGTLYTRSYDIAALPDFKAGEIRTFQWDYRDDRGRVVKPGRYLVRVYAEARPGKAGAGPVGAVASPREDSVSVNMAQVVRLWFDDDFVQDLDVFGLRDQHDLIREDVRRNVEWEYRNQNQVHLAVTLDDPGSEFDYTTMEIGGGRTLFGSAMFGLATYDLGNQKSNQRILHERGEGVWPRSYWDKFINGSRVDSVERAEFRSIFWKDGNPNYSSGLAGAVFTNLVSSVAIHELAHSLGLVAGPTIGSYAEPLPQGAVRYDSKHVEGGRAGPGLNLYMTALGSFREDGMIQRTATLPFSFDQQGMLPTDFSPGFDDVQLLYLRRLLPMDRVVP